MRLPCAKDQDAMGRAVFFCFMKRRHCLTHVVLKHKAGNCRSTHTATNVLRQALLGQASHQLLTSVYGTAVTVTGILACDRAKPRSPAAHRIPKGWQGARARQSRDAKLYCIIGLYTQEPIPPGIETVSPLKEAKEDGRKGTGGGERKKETQGLRP